MGLACASKDDAAGPTVDPATTPQREGGAGADAVPGSEADAIPTPRESAGSRLVPRYWRVAGSDGSELLSFQSWHDVQRDETCSFQTLSDGKLHCAPDGEEPVFHSEEFFSDPTCNSAVVGFQKYDGGDLGFDCVQPRPATKRYLRVANRATDLACAPTKLAPFPTERLAITTVYRKVGNQCQAYPLSTQGVPVEVFRATSAAIEIAPSEFVEIAASDETPATSERLRISHTRWTGADGSHALSRDVVVDSVRNELCVPRADRNGVSRCLPQASDVYADFGEYADSGCTRRAYSVANNGGCITDARNPFERYMSMTTYDGCGGVKTEIYPRFTSNPLPRVYSGSPSSCQSYDLGPNSGYRYYDTALPAPIDPTSLVPFGYESVEATTPDYGKAGARLGLRDLSGVGPNVSFSFYRGFFDRVLGESCYPATLEDGKTYCVGGYDNATLTTRTSVTYADAACTDQVIGVSRPAASCAQAPRKKLIADRPYSTNGCTTYRFFETPPAPESIAQLYTRDGTGACRASTTPATSYDLYRLSKLKPAAPSTFVAIDSSVVERK